ncbi:MAG TPA: hypothetical protein VEB21_09890 [Terriglobales bacterium]|nr:hypothetical protein [Terriglobales bacterium]
MRAAKASIAALLLLAVYFSAPSPTYGLGEGVDGFPNWAERVIHQWMNRARVDPQTDMANCGSNCGEKACYGVMPPLTWDLNLNRAARFHSDAMRQQSFFAHNSACTLVPNINTIYPDSCNGAASCACVGGTKSCSGSCTGFSGRVALFGGDASGEIIASPTDPNTAFYLWLYEPAGSSCSFSSANGHRFLILKSQGKVGVGVSGPAVGDFGWNITPAKLPSGSHYPRQAASVEAWANWYDTAAPQSALVNVDGQCFEMNVGRGTASNGAYRATLPGFGSGCHRYYFSFIDAAGNTVQYPTTGSLGIGPAGSCPDWDSSRPMPCFSGPTWTPTITATPTLTRSMTPTTSFTPTRSATSTRTATRTPTFTASRTSTRTWTPTRTATRTQTGTVTRTSTPTQPFTATPTSTRTPTSLGTSTPSHTSLPSPTQTDTRTFSPTTTWTRSATPTQTQTATRTDTPTVTPTITHTPTATATSLPTQPIMAVTGMITHYGSGDPVPGVTVDLLGIPLHLSDTTGADGVYGAAVTIGLWTVHPSKSGDENGAIDDNDVAALLAAKVGLMPLTGEMRIAGDVSGDGELSAYDAALVWRRAHGMAQTFPITSDCDSDWAFFPEPAEMPNQTLVLPALADNCTAGGIVYAPLLLTAQRQNFRAVLIGDVDHSWRP